MSDLDDLEEIAELFDPQRLHKVTPKMIRAGKRRFASVCEAGHAGQRTVKGLQSKYLKSKQAPRITLASRA